MDSDAIAKWLRPYGRLSVYQSDSKGTYSAKLRLFVEGCSMEVHSDFDYPSMLAALSALKDKTQFVLTKSGAI